MGSTVPPCTFRQRFWQSIAATEGEVQNRFSIDADDWLKKAQDHFQENNGDHLRWLEAEAVAIAEKILLNEYLRSGRSANVEQVRELQRIATRATRANRYEVIEIERGQYVKKREIDCTVRERISLAEQYEKRSQSDLRRARYHRFVAAQLVLEGMGQNDSLQDWIRREDAVGQ